MTNVAHATIIAMRNTASKTAKIALLKKQEKNTFLKEYLRMMYEAKLNFYIKKVEPELADTQSATVFDEKTLTALKANICNRKVTGGAARTALANLHESFQTPEEKELLELLIERDAKSGFGASTINKVWPDLILDVPYMRCCLPKDAKLDKFPWKDGVYSEMKCDGMYANVTHRSDGSVTIASRSGSPFPIEMFKDIEREVIAKVPACNQMNGELLMYQHGELLPRQLGNGMFNSIQQGGELEPGCVPIYVAWDIIPEIEAKAKNKYRVAYKDRFAKLRSALGYKSVEVPVPHGKAPLQVLHNKLVYSFKEAKQHYKEMLLAGYEGTIIKHPEMIWEDTTSKFQVKMKLIFECDLKVVGFNPGKGKNEVLFGSIQLETSDGKLAVGMSGFSDKLRKQLWDDRVILLGKIMTVKSNCLMEPSKDGGLYSLFLPRYQETRLDKKTADNLARVIAQAEAAIESVA